MKRFLYLLIILGAFLSKGIIAMQPQQASQSQQQPVDALTSDMQDLSIQAQSIMDKVNSRLNHKREELKDPAKRRTHENNLIKFKNAHQTKIKEKISNAYKKLGNSGQCLCPADDIIKAFEAEGLKIIYNPTIDTETQLDSPNIWTFFSQNKYMPGEKDKALTEQAIINLIEQEKESIKAALFEFNLYDIAYALCKAHARGVNVEIILNAGKSTKRSPAQLLLHRCGIDIKYYLPTPQETLEGGGILHTKIFIFKSKNGIPYLNKLKGIKNTPLGEKSAILLSGLRNLTGSGMNKNMEISNFFIDNLSIKEADEMFDTIKIASIKQAKTPEKLLALEKVSIKDSDVKLNDVPSQNVLYLLQSYFLTPENNWFYLGKKEIFENKDFLPSSLKKDSSLPQIIPDGMLLSGPCYLQLKNKKTYFVNNNQWLETPLQDLKQYTIYTLKLHGIGFDSRIKGEPLWIFKYESSEGIETRNFLKDLLGESLPEELKLYGPYKQGNNNDLYQFTKNDLKTIINTSPSRDPKYEPYLRLFPEKTKDSEALDIKLETFIFTAEGTWLPLAKIIQPIPLQ